jgi:hypothetical protein
VQAAKTTDAQAIAKGLWLSAISASASRESRIPRLALACGPRCRGESGGRVASFTGFSPNLAANELCGRPKHTQAAKEFIDLLRKHPYFQKTAEKIEKGVAGICE